jgi:hypothetical protein
MVSSTRICCRLFWQDLKCIGRCCCKAFEIFWLVFFAIPVFLGPFVLIGIGFMDFFLPYDVDNPSIHIGALVVGSLLLGVEIVIVFICIRQHYARRIAMVQEEIMYNEMYDGKQFI